MVRERQHPRLQGMSPTAPIVISDEQRDDSHQPADQALSDSERHTPAKGSQSQKPSPSQPRNDQEEGSTVLSQSSSESDDEAETETELSKVESSLNEDGQENTEEPRKDAKPTASPSKAELSLEEQMQSLQLRSGPQDDPEPPKRQTADEAKPARPLVSAPMQPPVSRPSPQGAPAQGGIKPIENKQVPKGPYTGFSSYPSATNPFNIPKRNRPRPEHHRRDPRTQGQPRFGEPAKFGTQASTSQQVGDPRRLEPFQPSRPTSLNAKQPQYPISRPTTAEVTSIFRPKNNYATTKPAPPPIFSSRPTQQKPSQAKKPLTSIEKFKKLTSTDDPKPLSSDSSFNAKQDTASFADPYTYIDPSKASENLKALLEGALEDEEDKMPRTRSRAKKVDKDIDEITKQMGSVKVEDKAEEPKEAEAKGAEEEEEEDNGVVEGLKVKLLPHQIDGVTWMKNKETGKRKTRGVHPKGGILADDMGLGKTIQSIALLLTNPRPPKTKDTDLDEKKSKSGISADVGKGTLIIAPLALIKQWEGEIESKVEPTHKLTTCVYHGPQKKKYTSELARYDVVITTYGTLSAEHDAYSKKKSDAGIFHNVWYRIILDEAHTIKNRNAKVTQAACALDAEYRWCLTGTPMQNNLDEIQSLIHFLRIKPYENLSSFRDQITGPLNNGRGGLAIKRLQIVLKAFMKRRTKDVLKQDGGKSGLGSKEEGAESKGKPTGEFRITKREVIKVAAEFTFGERQFYSRLEDRTDKTLEKMIGSKLNYASALVLLLRLRQACNHPDLVKGEISKDKDSLLGVTSSQRSSRKSDASVDEMADMLGGLSVRQTLCDVCQKELTSGEASKSNTCSECDAALNPIDALSPKKKSSRPATNGASSDDQEEGAPSVRKPRNRRVVLDSDDEEEGDAKDESKSDEGSDSDSSDYDSVDDTIASTKTRKLMKILKKEAPKHKSIVFSFFTSMLDKIEPFLEQAGIGYARYDGGMRNDLREAALNKLRNNPDCRVLLCSLRAGSLGLNLTAASRVVILEPFWNPFVEEQAIDRVHRLNQTVDVKVYKLTIKDTVEERILDLQDRKRELANATIEGKQAANKLTMNDMLALFGRDSETRYREDDAEKDFSQRVKVLHKDSDFGVPVDTRDVSKPTRDRTSNGSYSTVYPKPVRRSGGKMESSNRGRRPVQESSVFGRRWD